MQTNTAFFASLFLTSLVCASGCDQSDAMGDQEVVDTAANGGKQDDADSDPDASGPPESPGYAYRLDLPGLFEVSGVAAGDELVVRAEPNAEADIIGSLQSDDDYIEVVAATPSGLWGVVNVGPESGWVEMSSLSRQVEAAWPSESLPDELSCAGTEPFWNAEWYGVVQKLAMGGLGEDDAELDLFDIMTPEGAGGGAPFRVLTAGDQSQQVTMTITPGLCDNGSSDNLYGLRATVTTHDSTGELLNLRTGCCSLNY